MEQLSLLNNGDLLRDNNLRVVHIRPDKEEILPFGSARGMTIAFRDTGKPVIEISTALCKNGDTFAKKVGTYVAVQNFLSGHTIRVPINRDLGIIDTLKLMFA
jgi:hypothetical protein